MGKVLYFVCALLVLSAVPASLARAEEHEGTSEEAEATVVAGIGGANDIDLGDGSANSGVNAFVEVTAIEHWLALELSVSSLSAEGGTETVVDFLFKKPFRLSPKLEMLVGLGPHMVQFSGTKNDGTFTGTEAALDFMYWITPRVGVWVQPTYDTLTRDGTHDSFGTTAGIFTGW